MNRDLKTVQQGYARPDEPCLVVITHGVAATYPVERGVELVVGRSEDCDIQVDHPSISRRHARLRVADALVVQDLGSANGTFVAGRTLSADECANVPFGQAIELGGVTVLAQRCGAGASSARLWTHGYFELRVDDQCQRSTSPGSSFGLVRLHTLDDDAVSRAVPLLQALLSSGDSIGVYGPGELELLLVGRAVKDLELFVERLQRNMEAAAIDCRIGIASFPLDGTSSHALLARANERLRTGPSHAVVMESGAMQVLDNLVRRVAAGSIALLVRGETGVGKEVFSRKIHSLSPRADKPLLAINCAAFSDSLLESELFGYEKGAFTGAVAAKPGLLESANGGTVFLDEVGDLPMALQAKLLRVLQEKEVLRVGALRPRSIDVRFVSATNVDLAQAVQNGKFREDLLYRLDGATLQIPPLRERVEEIEPLAEQFCREASSELGRAQPPLLSAEVRELLRAYRWPGNIRELRNVIERAVLLADEVIEPAHLPMEKMSALPLSEPVRVEAPAGDKRARIIAALKQCAGNQTRAAELLKISRRTLSAWLDKYDVPRPTKGRT